jgi:moderate conductance mechanosensitive channel
LVSLDLGPDGRIRAFLLVIGFLALGTSVEWLFRKATAGLSGRLERAPAETVNDRLYAVVARLAMAVGRLVAFALGSIGAFLALDWSPLLREIVSGYLIAILAIRAVMIVARLMLSPAAERFRIIPSSEAAARFWFIKMTAFVGWFAFGYVWLELTQTLGFSPEGRQLLAYALGLGLLAIALEAVWRRPATAVAGGEAKGDNRRFNETTRNILLSVAIVLLWVLWVLRAMPSFWLLLVIIMLPLANSVLDRAIENLLRPPGLPQTATGSHNFVTVGLERGLRAFLIIGGAAVLAWGWGIDLVHLTSQDTLVARLVHGALSAVIILLIADVVWHTTSAAIDSKMTEAGDLGQPNTDEARRRARIRTLLPIFRNILFVIVIAVAVMMALAAMGVEIGPLIAGASVVGVAIGFGAQTFVRDVIAGMFYLVDDAFRVGEYIQSGNYKGTVEGFSIRSIKLRHHRGPIYTVPFGLLGAVQNQSRDWVIDKMTIGVTYDSDVERARKLIKQIGQQLAQDPEYAPLIIEPLKMQGIEQFGDFAVQIRTKMMTVPGEQFVIRRKALAMIKKAFDENGIKFAFPTVQIAGEREPVEVAAAQHGLSLTKPAAA